LGLQQALKDAAMASVMGETTPEDGN